MASDLEKEIMKSKENNQQQAADFLGELDENGLDESDEENDIADIDMGEDIEPEELEKNSEYNLEGDEN